MSVAAGKLPSKRALLLCGALFVFLFPGLGLLILPTVITERTQWGGLGWMAFWALPPVLVYLLARVHEVDGDHLTVRSHRWTRTRSLGDVVSVQPAPLYYPAAVGRFADGTKAWLPPDNGLLDAALAAVPPAAVALPHGNWLRRRRVAWFVLAFAGVASS